MAVNVLHSVVYSIKHFWRNAASSKSSTSPYAMHISTRIVTFRTTANSNLRQFVKNYFPPNIVQAKNNTLTVTQGKVYRLRYAESSELIKIHVSNCFTSTLIQYSVYDSLYQNKFIYPLYKRQFPYF